MGFEVSQSVTIAAQPETIWSLLIDPNTWSTWWPACLAAQSGDFRALREGSRLELVLQPGQTKTTLHPVVDLLSEGKSLSLTARGPLLQTTVAWYLQPTDRGTTRVSVHGAFAGLASGLMRIFRRDDTVRLAINSNLRGLKRTSERLV